MSKQLTASDYQQMALEIKDMAYAHKPWWSAPLGEMCEEYCGSGPLDNGLTPDVDTLYAAVCQLSNKEANDESDS